MGGAWPLTCVSETWDCLKPGRVSAVAKPELQLMSAPAWLPSFPRLLSAKHIETESGARHRVKPCYIQSETLPARDEKKLRPRRLSIIYA
jgi:hypothetical protein